MRPSSLGPYLLGSVVLFVAAVLLLNGARDVTRLLLGLGATLSGVVVLFTACLWRLASWRPS